MWPVLLVTLGVCHAERGPLEGLPPAIRSEVGKTAEMTPCVVASLPSSVRRALAELAREQDLTMADPGQEWNSSDKGGGGLPRKLLVRAAHSERAWVVDYWKGGFAATYRVVVIGIDGDNGRVLWSGECHNGNRGKGKWQCRELGK